MKTRRTLKLPEEARPAWDAFLQDSDGSLLGAFLDGRRSMIEECARVAEEKYKGHGKAYRTERAHNYEHAGRQIASSIRALAGKVE